MSTIVKIDSGQAAIQLDDPAERLRRKLAYRTSTVEAALPADSELEADISTARQHTDAFVRLADFVKKSIGNGQRLGSGRASHNRDETKEDLGAHSNSVRQAFHRTHLDRAHQGYAQVLHFTDDQMARGFQIKTAA